MRNLILSALSAGLLFATAPATPASAAVGVNIGLHFGDAPQVYFARPPRTILIPDTPVYYVEGTDYDMFQCDGIWYVDNGGYWFSAPSYRGPFEPIDYDDVPSVVVNVPSAYVHQPYRPGMWRSDSRGYGYGGGYGYSNGRTYLNTRNWQNWQNTRNWQNTPGWQNSSDQRWQQRQGWQRDNQSQGWQQDRQNQGWQRNGQSNDQRDWGRGHGNGHDNGRGNGNGNGHGRGRGHDRGDD